MATTKVKADSKALNKEIGDALFSEDERFEMFFAANWKKILVAALAVVVAITAVFAIRLHSSNAKKQAAAKLTEAATPAALEKALAENADAASADAARFRLAGMYIAEKKYDQALQVFDKLSSTAKEPELRDKARLNAAYMLEMSGKNAEAAQKFAAVAAPGTSSPAVRAEAAYSAGRLFIALGKKEDAKKILAQLNTLELPQGAQSAGSWKERALELETTII